MKSGRWNLLFYLVYVFIFVKGRLEFYKSDESNTIFLPSVSFHFPLGLFGCPFYMFLVHANRVKKCPCGHPLCLVSALFFLPRSIARSIQARHHNKENIYQVETGKKKKKEYKCCNAICKSCSAYWFVIWVHPNGSLSLLVPIKSWFDQHVFIWGCEI